MMNTLRYHGSIYGLAGIAIERRREKEQQEREERERAEAIKASRNITRQGIFDDVCDVFDIDPMIAVKSTHREDIARVRHMYCYLCRKFTDISFRNIGLLIGVDHTSVIYGDNKIKGFLDINDQKFLPYWRFYLHNSKLFTPEDFI